MHNSQIKFVCFLSGFVLQENNINPRVYSGLANYAAKVLKNPSAVEHNGYHDPSLATVSYAILFLCVSSYSSYYPLIAHARRSSDKGNVRKKIAVANNQQLELSRYIHSSEISYIPLLTTKPPL